MSSTAALPVIVVGSDNYPPFNYTGSDGQPTGVDVELAQEAFRRMGYQARFVTINWEEKKALLENGLPELWALYSLQDRDLIYTTLIKGYADALAAHESAIQQFMKDYSVEYRILAQPLMLADLGVAFAKDRTDDIPQQLTDTFAQMLADGTTREIVSRYLDEPDHYLEGLEVDGNG